MHVEDPIPHARGKLEFPLSFFVPLLLGIAFTLFGLLMMGVISFGPWYDWMRTRIWARQEAELTSAENLEYRYARAGKEFVSYVYSPWNEEGDEADPKTVFKRQHRSGEKIPVLVNPSDPSESVITAEWNSDARATLIPFVFLLPGLLTMWLAFAMGWKDVRQWRLQIAQWRKSRYRRRAV